MEASAPDLVEALKQALPWLQDHQNQCHSVGAAKAFIDAKAALSKAGVE